MTLWIYSNKWHIYAGLAMFNSSIKKHIEQCIEQLYKLMFRGHRKAQEKTRTIKACYSKNEMLDKLSQNEAQQWLKFVGDCPLLPETRNRLVRPHELLDTYFPSIAPSNRAPNFGTPIFLTKFLRLTTMGLAQMTQNSPLLCAWSGCVSSGDLKSYHDRSSVPQSPLQPLSKFLVIAGAESGPKVPQSCALTQQGHDVSLASSFSSAKILSQPLVQ